MAKGGKATRNSDGTVSRPISRTARDGGTAQGVKPVGTKVGTPTTSTRIKDNHPGTRAVRDSDAH